MATEVAVTIDCGGGAADYTSISDMEAGEQGDITAAGDDTYVTAKCRTTNGDPDTTAVSISGWTTDATHYLRIYTDTGEAFRHAGKWTSGAYTLTGSNANILTSQEGCVWIEGLQFELTIANAASSYYAIKCTGPDDDIGYIRQCIVKGVFSGSNAAQRAIWCGDGTGTGTWEVENCIVYDFVNGTEAHAAYRARASSSTVTVSNCLAYNCRTGFQWITGTALWKNCGAVSCNTPFSGGTQTTCSSTTPTFVAEASDDFHIGNDDETWRGAGTDLSASFTVDIDNDTRAAPWDIGPDQLATSTVAVAIPVTATVAISLVRNLTIDVNLPTSATVAIVLTTRRTIEVAVGVSVEVAILPAIEGYERVQLALPTSTTVAIVLTARRKVAIAIPATVTVAIVPNADTDRMAAYLVCVVTCAIVLTATMASVAPVVVVANQVTKVGSRRSRSFGGSQRQRRTFS